jgi:hypothetical protein
MRTHFGSASGLSGVCEKTFITYRVDGPAISIVRTICCWIPFTIVAMVMTVLIPITTPRIVSPERILLVRNVDSATATFSCTVSTRFNAGNG